MKPQKALQKNTQQSAVDPLGKQPHTAAALPVRLGRKASPPTAQQRASQGAPPQRAASQPQQLIVGRGSQDGQEQSMYASSEAPFVPRLPSGEPLAAAVKCDLSLPTIAADLPSATPHWTWAAISFLVVFIVYLAFIPHVLDYSSPPTGDQPFYLMQAASLAEDGDLNLANQFAKREEDKFYSLAPHSSSFVGMGAPYPLPLTHILTWSIRPSTEMWGFHQPGLPVLMVPAWIVGSWFQLWWPATMVLMSFIGALVALNVFLLSYELTGRYLVAFAVWAVMAFSNPLMTYSFLIFSELTTGLFAIYLFRRLAQGWGANGWFRLLLLGTLTGYISWFSWRCIVISGPLMLYALVQWWRYNRSIRGVRAETALTRGVQEVEPIREEVVLMAGSAETNEATTGARVFAPRQPNRNSGSMLMLWVFCLPVAVSAVLTVVWNMFLFGRPLPPDRVPEIATDPFLWPWQSADNFVHFVRTGFALMFDRLAGLLVYTPVFLLAAVGMIAMYRSTRRSDRRLLGILTLVCLPYVLLLMSYSFWSGIWCPPARFMTALVPMLAAPLSMSLVACSSIIYRLLFGLLALPGYGFMAIMMSDPRTFWPASSPVNWLNTGPLPIHLDIVDMLANYSDFHRTLNPLVVTAWPIIVSVALVMSSTLLMRHWASKRQKWPVAARGGAWFGAVVILALGWTTMNYDNLDFKHHTTLTQLARWTVPNAPTSPPGIAYISGRVYIPSFTGNYLGALDTSTGKFNLLNLLSPGGTPAITSPTSAVVASDGSLYVLNNVGPSKGPLPAITVINPHGQVTRQISLAGLSDIVTDLGIGRDGSLYVADIRLGLVHKFAPTGGTAVWTNGNFDNIMGILLDTDGSIYAAEMGKNRLQHLDALGNFISAFNLPCQPLRMVMSGDWIDTACADQVISVNKKTGETQQVLLNSNDHTITAPEGLTYGPDGTLYLLDTDTLIAYRVQH